MKTYLELLRRVREHGVPKNDRTGTGTRALFGYQMRFDLAAGFPLVTTKKIHLPALVHELLWFLSGETNTRYLAQHGVRIWDEWADANGELGPVYGKQWRRWQAADGRLSCQLYQRSADVFLGVPFNIASYALLTHMCAQQCDLEPGEFIWSGGDCHLYANHFEQADAQLARIPLQSPRLVLRRRPTSLFDYQYEDFDFVNYQFHPAIKAPIAV